MWSLRTVSIASRSLNGTTKTSWRTLAGTPDPNWAAGGPSGALLIHQTGSKKKGLGLGIGELDLVFTHKKADPEVRLSI